MKDADNDKEEKDGSDDDDRSEESSEETSSSSDEGETIKQYSDDAVKWSERWFGGRLDKCHLYELVEKRPECTGAMKKRRRWYLQISDVVFTNKDEVNVRDYT